jgi:hypothetical protein
MPESDTQLELAVTRLAELLERIGHPSAHEVRRLLTVLVEQPQLGLRELNQNRWWAGAGSWAAETMADNPGLSEAEWMLEVREFRTLLIEIGERLLESTTPNPGISSWLSAFHHWNEAGV